MDAVHEVIARLKTANQTVAFAESCTSGRLSAAFGAVPGVSKIFKGAVVSYANDVKEDLLDVPHDLLVAAGAVSESVAARMAEGALKRMHASWAIAVTGIAGPDGGSSEKPVGTVCFAVAGLKLGKDLRQTQTRTLNFRGERCAIQQQAVDAAVTFLRDQLILN